MVDRDKVQRAVDQERSMEFWFSNRQPRYQQDFTERYGEWFDDKIFKLEERAESEDTYLDD